MRKLATIREIDKITPIDGADKIELAHVGGWRVVVQKGEYTEGDRAVYCEIDSWIPTELAPFLSKGKEPREYNGVKGERLRTIKLRGQISQGLLLKTSIETDGCLVLGDLLDIGEDVTERLNIQKWEPEIPVQMQGKVKGSFPSYIPKTDQERVQNLSDKDLQEITSVGFEVSEKLEGSSITIFQPLGSDELGVCSRNIWLDVSDTENVFVKTAIEEGFEGIDSRYAFQGELVGEGVQGNIYKLKGQRIYIYNVYDISNGKYLPPVDAKCYVESLGFKYVPVKYYHQDQPNSLTIGDFVEEAEGISNLAGVQQEGIVVKSLCGQKSFKAINNKYLLGEK